MKGITSMQDEAVGFDYPNNVAPENYNHIHYGNQYVPKPTNSAAKITPSEKVMRAVLEAE